jgi:hypothetical protein
MRREVIIEVIQKGEHAEERGLGNTVDLVPHEYCDETLRCVAPAVKNVTEAVGFLRGDGAFHSPSETSHRTKECLDTQVGSKLE